MSVPPATPESSSSQSFWTEYQPGFRATDAPAGSPEFFAHVEAHRYALEPDILEVVQFERWVGSDVLEAGCGIATDGMRFVRVGARYTGMDFSPTALEHASATTGARGRGSRVRPRIHHRPPVPRRVVRSCLLKRRDPPSLRDTPRDRRVPSRPEARWNGDRDGLPPPVLQLLRVDHDRPPAVGLPAACARGPHGSIARVTGEQPDVLHGHRELLREHGPRYLADPKLFLSHNTDGPGNPLSKVYTADGDASRLLGDSRAVNTRGAVPQPSRLPDGERLERLPWIRSVGRRYGWHLWIRATKA